MQEFKELMAEVFEEQLGRKLSENSEFFGNGFGLNASKKTSKPKDATIYLTRGEVSKQLQISLPTLHTYTKDGLIKSYRMGGKVRYKAQEIEQTLTERNFKAVNRKGGNYAA